MSGFSSATKGSNHTMHWSEEKVYNLDEIRNGKIRFVHVIKYKHIPSVISFFRGRDEKFLSDNERKKR